MSYVSNWYGQSLYLQLVLYVKFLALHLEEQVRHSPEDLQCDGKWTIIANDRQKERWEAFV